MRIDTIIILSTCTDLTKQSCLSNKAWAPPTSNTVDLASRISVNLSDEIKLLSKWLKFAPEPPRINLFQSKQDLKDSGRRLRLQESFFNPDKNDEEEYDIDARCFKPASTWTPKWNREISLEAYLQAVEDEMRLTKSIWVKNNLTLIEWEGLSKLSAMIDLVIKPADKGSATVVMSKEDYVAEVWREVVNSKYYRKLE